MTTPDSIASQLTALVITFNEAPNIGRCLDRLKWVPRVLVIDSGSTDATLDIVATYPNAEVVHRPFDDFAGQCNFGLSLVENGWVLSLDADYVLTHELAQEIQRLKPQSFAAFEASFVYCVYGQPLRGTLYPPRKLLYAKAAAHYVNEGHGHRVVIDGHSAKLAGKIHHDDRKPLSRWLGSQQKYAAREAQYLLSSGAAHMRRTDRIRRMAWPAPVLVFVYTLIVKGCLLDGWPGWVYVLQRVLAEVMIALEVIDRKLSGSTHA